MVAMVQATLPSPPETLRPMMKGKLLPFRHGHEYAARFQGLQLPLCPHRLTRADDIKSARR